MNVVDVAYSAILILHVGIAQANTHRTRLHDLKPYTHSSKNRVMSQIPPILHQSWKTEYLPSNAHTRWQQTWLEVNPSWRVILWTDKDNRELVRVYYPWLLNFYDSLVGVYRADLVSFLRKIRMMHRV